MKYNMWECTAHRKRTQVDNNAVGKGQAGSRRTGKVQVGSKAAACFLGWGRGRPGDASGHAKCGTEKTSSGLSWAEDGVLLLQG